MRGSVLALAVLCSALAGRQSNGAEVTSNDAASIIVFPKIMADGARDTFVQITNVAALQTFVHCVYVNAGGTCELDGLPCLHADDCAPMPVPNACMRVWQAADFDIELTADQPTNWVVSRGRPGSAAPPCSPTDTNCYGAGLDALFIPPVLSGFRGELLCIETAADGSPVIRNGLVGVATLEDRTTGDAAKYNAIGLRGLQPSADRVLVLGQEYAGCPETWLLQHAASGAENALAGSGSSIATTLTLIPCAHDLANLTPASANILVEVTNEFEQHLSFASSFTGYEELALVAVGVAGSPVVQSRIRSVGTSSGLLAVAEEVAHTDVPADLTARALINLHHEGVRTQPDEIRLAMPPPLARTGATK